MQGPYTQIREGVLMLMRDIDDAALRGSDIHCTKRTVDIVHSDVL